MLSIGTSEIERILNTLNKHIKIYRVKAPINKSPNYLYWGGQTGIRVECQKVPICSVGEPHKVFQNASKDACPVLYLIAPERKTE